MWWRNRATNLKSFYEALSLDPKEYARFRVITDVIKDRLWSDVEWTKDVDQRTFGAIVIHTVAMVAVVENIDQEQIRDLEDRGIRKPKEENSGKTS